MPGNYCIVKAERAFLYDQPGDEHGCCESELTDEMLSGWAMEILEESSGNWLRVRTFYGYEGWIFGETVKEIRENELRCRQDKKVFRMIRARSADLLSEPKVQGAIRENLLQDSIVEILEGMPSGSWIRVRAASGKEGWVFGAALRERKEDDRFLLTGDGGSFREMAEEVKKSTDEEHLRREVIRSAFSYEGTQYRWGGKSPSGIDCSGLVFMSYLEQGILIYRDACLREAFPVREIGREELREGDLIFFPGHVALSLGGSRFIHATGYAGTPRVLVNSLSQGDPDYRPDLRDRITMCGSVLN